MKKILAGLLGLISTASVQADTGLDFSDITTREKAEALYSKGKLEKILLFPSELGGEDVPPNTAFVPLGISEIKNQVTGTLVRYLEEGTINKLTVEPEYKGESFIPSKIKMRAWHSDKKGEFNPSIEVW
ncbi:MAG: hypothetical protein WCG35_11380 [Betaproteobacteria bacterium]